MTSHSREPTRGTPPSGEETIRYAVVGIGHISQVAVLPAFEHAHNAELAALVSGDPVKLRELGRRHGVNRLVSYDDYDELLRSGEIDAVYIAVPNHEHRDLTIRAAEAGVHVLCEKPMAMNEDDCRAMIDACERHDVRLMVAYRLHFEHANMSVVDEVQSGVIGEPRVFESVFSLPVRKDDVRVDERRGGGPMFDIGVYCINAARYIFRNEPTKIAALRADGRDERFREVEEAVSVSMWFPGDRLASFTVSFGATSIDSYHVVGTQGHIRVSPAYGYASEMSYEVTTGERTRRYVFEKHDQFAPELVYFGNCIAERRQPEPDGYEGLADVRIVRAARRCAAEGIVMELEPVPQQQWPDGSQAMWRPAVPPQPEVHESGPRKK